jgi:hypothetical protein
VPSTPARSTTRCSSPAIAGVTRCRGPDRERQRARRGGAGGRRLGDRGSEGWSGSLGQPILPTRRPTVRAGWTRPRRGSGCLRLRAPERWNGSRAGVVHLEDAAHDGRRVGVRFEGAELGTGSGLRAVGVREAGVDEPVAVVGASAEPAPVRRGPASTRAYGAGCRSARPSRGRRRGSSPGRGLRCPGRSARRLRAPTARRRGG